jgi:hypothetical protein
VTATAVPTRLRRAMKSAQVHVKDVPATLYNAVEADARERDWNRNDVICEILAARFRIPCPPSEYPFRDAVGSQQWMLRMPVPLRDAIKRTADETSSPGRRIAVSRLIISTLQAHYDLPVESPRRRPSQPPLDPVLVREARARHEAGESLRSLAKRYQVKRETLTRAIRSA